MVATNRFRVSSRCLACVAGSWILFGCNTGGTALTAETSASPAPRGGSAAAAGSNAAGGDAGAGGATPSTGGSAGGAGASGAPSTVAGPVSECVTGPVKTVSTLQPSGEKCPKGVAWMHGFSPGSSGFTADGDTAWLAGAPEPNTVPANQGDCPAGSPAFPAAGFLAAYDVASGAAKWVRALAPDARPRAVKRLSSGALAVLGRGGCYIPPPLKLGSTVDPTRFVSVISADGAELAWSRAYAVSTAFEHDQLEPTPDGGLLVTGTTLDDVVGDIAIAAPGVGSDEHSFIAKLDPKGNVVWTILVHATHPAYLVLFGMSAASDGVVHLLGQWNGPDELVFVSDLTLSGKGTFYAQIDGATGHGLAIRKLSDVEEKPLARIVTASGGGVYVSGPVDPASCPAIAPSMIPSNLVRLDAAGECVWRGAQMPGLNAPPLIPGAVLQALIGAGESPAPVVGMPGGWVATVDPVTGVIAQGTKVDVSGSDVVVAARLVVGFSGGVAGAD